MPSLCNIRSRNNTFQYCKRFARMLASPYLPIYSHHPKANAEPLANLPRPLPRIRRVYKASRPRFLFGINRKSLRCRKTSKKKNYICICPPVSAVGRRCPLQPTYPHRCLRWPIQRASNDPDFLTPRMRSIRLDYAVDIVGWPICIKML